MTHQIQPYYDERGGIQLRDFTSDRKAISRHYRQKGFLQRINTDRLGRGLGWFSLGLGLAQVLIPGRLQRLAGVRRGDHRWLIRAVGLREIGSWMFIFMQPQPLTSIWARVAGDAMDLGALGLALAEKRNDRSRLIPVTAFIGGVTALDVLTGVLAARKRDEKQRISTLTRADLNSRASGGEYHVSRKVTINRPAEELYAFWRDFENLPRFMYHLKTVQVRGSRRSHWVARAPAGTEVEWDAEISEDRPGELIAWHSLPGSQVVHSGMVRFEPAPVGRGTVVHVEMDYRPPGGGAGRMVARLFGEAPSQQVAGDLRRFKQVMEAGEVIRSSGVPAGYGQKMQRPAQPLPAGEQERSFS